MTLEFDNTTFENKPRLVADYSPLIRTIKSDIIKSLALAGSGHPGGALGIAELMTVLYFGGVMQYKPQEPAFSMRDRFVLSAGHYAPVMYACLARAGFFSPTELASLRKKGSRLQGHPHGAQLLPGNETTAGSLGQGISIAVGMAMSDKLIDKNQRKVFCLTGDGELQEGSCWEAAMAAGMHKLNNLCWIVDNNDCQIDGRVKDVMSIYPLADKFNSFNFNVLQINGNNISEVITAFKTFNESSTSKPTCIIAKTIMGNNISFMHDNHKWHGNPPNIKQAEQALEEIAVPIPSMNN